MLSIKIVQLLYFDKFCSRNWKNGQKKDRHKCGELRTYDGLSALVRNIGHTFWDGLAFIYSNFYSAFGWVFSTSTFLPLIFSSNSGYTRRAVAEPKTINSYNNCGSSVVLDNKRR